MAISAGCLFSFALSLPTMGTPQERDAHARLVDNYKQHDRCAEKNGIPIRDEPADAVEFSRIGRRAFLRGSD